MHKEAQSKQDASLTPQEPSRGRGGSPARCLPFQILRGRRRSPFRPGVHPPTSSLCTSPPPISAPAGRTEGGHAAGQAGGPRPNRGVTGRWRAEQVALEQDDRGRDSAASGGAGGGGAARRPFGSRWRRTDRLASGVPGSDTRVCRHCVVPRVSSGPTTTNANRRNGLQSVRLASS